MPVNSASRIARFSTFEVDLQTGELRQRGQKIRLQEQPFQVLAALLERPGELVTRENLRTKLWPADTFVEFDHGLNAAIKRLRDALGESAETPIFVETVARRGYRFIGNVELPVTLPPAGGNSTSLVGHWTSKWQFGGTVLAIVLFTGIATSWFFWYRASGPKLSQDSAPLQRLTTNGTENWIIASAISPDGKYLAYSDKTGVYLRLLSTGELHPLLPKISDVTSLAWFPDGTQLLASWSDPPEKRRLWIQSIVGGSPRRISDEGWAGSVSPNGSQIVFLKGAAFSEMGHELWLMPSNGAVQRRLVSFPEGQIGSPTWSPDGRHIAYVKSKSAPSTDEPSIEVFNLEEGTTTLLLSDARVGGFALDWLRDGRLIYAMYEPPPSQNSSNLWTATIDSNTGKLLRAPARITHGDGFAVRTSSTADGKRLVFNRTKIQPDVYVSEFFPKGPRLGTLRQLTFDQGDDLPFDWTIDNQSVLFTSNRTGATNIFRQRVNETSAEMLVVDQEKKSAICRLSPDGSQILYSVPMNPNDDFGPVRLMRAPINGGPSHIVLEAPAIGNFVCSHVLAGICAFGQEKPKELVISVFNPAMGEKHEVATFQKETGDWIWGLSPDGTSIAAFPFGTGNRIRLLSVSGQPLRELTVKNWSAFTSLDWAADSKGLFISSNPTGLRQSLLYMDLAGNAHEIWQVNNIWPSWAIPSRDGKYLAILAPTTDSNVWMAKNF